MDDTNIPLLMAAAVLMAAPIVLFVLLVQILFLRNRSLAGIVDEKP